MSNISIDEREDLEKKIWEKCEESSYGDVLESLICWLDAETIKDFVENNIKG